MPTAALYPPAQRTGEPVPADERTCAMDDIHSATAGVWNGVPVTLDDMRAMADNFDRFSSGPEPYYQPFLNLNHEDALNSGVIVGARFDGSELHLDADNIPESVGKWANAKRLHGASIEFWEPKWDDSGALVGTFMMPDGNYCDTPVIKCLSLLGNQAPGMKGMAALPTARFSDSHTTGVPSMGRDEMIAALAAQGFDTARMNDLDTLLAYLVECKAKPGEEAAPVLGDPAEGQAPIPMADMGATVGAGAPAGVSIPSATGAPAPTSLTLKFNDSHGKPITANVAIPNGFALVSAADRAALANIAKRGTAVAADLARQRENSKRVAIQAFGDRMAAAHVAPATIAAQKAVLNALDHDVTRKFADGKGTGTALEEAIGILEAGAVPNRKFQEQIKDGDGKGKTIDPGTGNVTQTQTDWESRKRAMMANDPVFSAKLRRLEKAAAKK